MRALKTLALALGGLVLGQQAQAAEDFLAGIPRNEILIAENPEGTVTNPSVQHLGGRSQGGMSTGLQQLCMDTLWYIDPDYGLNGRSGTTRSPPTSRIYNKDFTEMTVKLRPGIFWSDGVEFTADDVVYTVETQMKTPAMRLTGARFAANVDSVIGARQEHRRLQAEEAELALPRDLHGALERDLDHAEARLREAGRPDASSTSIRRSRSAPTRCKSFDPNGAWFIWQKRDDWQRTTLARFGEPGPKYVAYIDPGPPDKRVILQQNHQLDIIHDTSPEGVFTLVKSSPSSHGWFKGFPYAHPDPTLPMVIFNHQLDKFQNPRRALGARARSSTSRRSTWRPIAARRRSRRSRSRRPAPIRTTTSSRWRTG